MAMYRLLTFWFLCVLLAAGGAFAQPGPGRGPASSIVPGTDLSTGNVTATGTTNSLATWESYLKGTTNPNPVNLGSSLSMQYSPTVGGLTLSATPFFISGYMTGSYAGINTYGYVGPIDSSTNTFVGEQNSALDVNLTFGTGEANRTGILGTISNNAATAQTNDQLHFYTGIFAQSVATTSDGGTGTGINAKGDFYGLGAIGQLNAGATNIRQNIGAEIDTSVQAGATTDYNGVLSLALVNSNAVHARVFESMLDFTADGTVTTYMNRGITFGRPDSFWPLSSTAIMIGTDAGSGTVQAATGIDFTAVAFSGNSIQVPGFTVSSTGSSAISTPYPAFQINDTANTVTNGGLVRLAGTGVGFSFQVNTAAGGDFSAATTAWSTNAAGNLVIAATGIENDGMVSEGTKFTATGCSVSATAGGAAAGKMTSGTTGTCTPVVTIAGATGANAPNGWSCWMSDQTTGNLMRQTASTTATATFSGTTVSGDVLVFGCLGY